MSAKAADKSLDWIKQIDQILLELEEKPQFGLPVEFDKERLEKYLRDRFNRPSLKIDYSLKGWTPADQLLSGLGEELFSLTVEWVPLTSSIYFLTTGHDLKRLMADLLGGEKEATYFYDPSLVQGFYHYFGAEMLQSLEELGFAKPLSPRLGELESEFAEKGPCFVIDVSISLNAHTFWGRILIPENFRSDWKEYFAHLPPPPVSNEMLEKIHVDLGLEVGHTPLSFEEWKQVREGDFILLDHCSYDPSTGKGGVVLTLNEKPLFRGRFKNGGIKLTEYPLYDEVSESMEEKPFEEEEEELFEEEDFGEEFSESDLYGDQLSEEEEEKEEEEEEAKPVEMAPSAPSISPEELPINLTVEVGRLRMSAKELMDLAPGNLLELNVAPEQGVDLVINGKKVGRGELIRLGEVLGVRILSL